MKNELQTIKNQINDSLELVAETVFNAAHRIESLRNRIADFLNARKITESELIFIVREELTEQFILTALDIAKQNISVQSIVISFNRDQLNLKLPITARYRFSVCGSEIIDNTVYTKIRKVVRRSDGLFINF
jgi:hypothetical protein